jgi:hypothetical protein
MGEAPGSASIRASNNPSNFGIVMVLLLGHGIASVAPGSQWGADYRVAFAILCLGMTMMVRLKKLELALGWIGGFVIMGLLRMVLENRLKRVVVNENSSR